MRFSLAARSLMVVAALAIGACGDSGDDDDTSGEETGTTAEDTSTTAEGTAELSGTLEVSTEPALVVSLERAAESLMLSSEDATENVKSFAGTDTTGLCSGTVHLRVVQAPIADSACELL